ncbi:MAG: phage holin family protein [Pseudomonadota bacterium]
MAPPRPSLVEVARTAAEDLLDLLVSQIKLARVELAADARGALKRIARLSLFIPPVIVGYAFAMGALVAWLRAFWPLPLALGAVAALQISVGVAGILAVLRGFGHATLLDRTAVEAAQSVRGAVVAVSPRKRVSDV